MHTANKAEYNLCIWLSQNMPVSARDLIDWMADEAGSNSSGIVVLFKAFGANVIKRDEVGWILTPYGNEIANTKNSETQVAPVKVDIINKRGWNTEDNDRLVFMRPMFNPYDVAIKLCRTRSAVFTQISKLNTSYDAGRKLAGQIRIKTAKPVSKMKAPTSKVITHQGHKYQLIEG